MSNTTPNPSQAPPKKRRSYKEYIIVLIIIGGIFGAAMYQEQITNYVTMQRLDAEGPPRQIKTFLTALQKGDQATADALFEPQTSYKPLMEGGKWNGYFIISQAGKMVFTLPESAPKGEVGNLKTEFNLNGKVSALVTAPDGRGKMVDFRLESFDGIWKITEMRGGRPDKPASKTVKKMTPPPVPGGGPKRPAPGGAPKTAPKPAQP